MFMSNLFYVFYVNLFIVLYLFILCMRDFYFYVFTCIVVFGVLEGGYI